MYNDTRSVIIVRFSNDCCLTVKQSINAQTQRSMIQKCIEQSNETWEKSKTERRKEHLCCHIVQYRIIYFTSAYRHETEPMKKMRNNSSFFFFQSNFQFPILAIEVFIQIDYLGQRDAKQHCDAMCQCSLAQSKLNFQ